MWRPTLLATLALVLAAGSIRAANDAADAVSALAQLTDPRRLSQLDDDAFRAQLGPALGWLHVARRRDISPEAVIARSFLLNGLDPERARRTRESLLRNFARADDWQLFQFAASAQPLTLGEPAPIQASWRRGRMAVCAVAAAGSREFSDLTLRSDDEPPLQSPPRRAGRRRVTRPGRRPTPPPVPLPPIEYNDAFPER